MARAKPIRICDFDECKNHSKNRDRFCSAHTNKATVSRFLSELYVAMSERTKGNRTKRPDLYKNLPILPKDVFYNWAKNHPEFLKLYKRWFTSGFDRKLTPTINRMNSSKGYTLDNIEWMTNSQNCGLSAGVRDMKKKKAIYDLLGVKNV
jgi:hypothetical protein